MWERVQARWTDKINTKITKGRSLDWKQVQCGLTCQDQMPKSKTMNCQQFCICGKWYVFSKSDKYHCTRREKQFLTMKVHCIMGRKDNTQNLTKSDQRVTALQESAAYHVLFCTQHIINSSLFCKNTDHFHSTEQLFF